MYEVMRSLTDQQKFQIADELERLFVLQDRPFSKDKSAVFLEELEKCGLPAGVLILGIRALMQEDLKTIKVANIIEASRSYLETEDKPKTKCDHCMGMGVVVLKDERKYDYSFSCVCENKGRIKNLPLWNGEKYQLLNGKTFHNRFM